MNYLMQLKDMNIFDGVVVVLLAILVAKFIYGLFIEDIIIKYGWESKKMRERREDHELVRANAQAIKDLAEIHKRDNDISNEHDDKLREDLSLFMTEVRGDIGELKNSMQESFDNSIKYRQVSIDKEKNLNSRIDNLVDLSKQRDVSVEAISNGLDKLTKMFVNKEISDYRWEIINFATAISENKPCTKEAFRHCFATYEKYEKILEENGLENGEVTVSMEIISEAYKKKMLEGF